MNALAALKQFPQADASRMGMWDHSMGGYLTLRAMVLSPDVKAGVIWAGGFLSGSAHPLAAQRCSTHAFHFRFAPLALRVGRPLRLAREQPGFLECDFSEQLPGGYFRPGASASRHR